MFSPLDYVDLEIRCRTAIYANRVFPVFLLPDEAYAELLFNGLREEGFWSDIAPFTFHDITLLRKSITVPESTLIANFENLEDWCLKIISSMWKASKHKVIALSRISPFQLRYICLTKEVLISSHAYVLMEEGSQWVNIK